MKHLIILFGFLLIISACSMEPSESPTSDDSQLEITAQVLTNIGKPLTTLQEEHPMATAFVRPDGYPYAAAICFGEPDAEIFYVLWGTQDGDYRSVIDTYSTQIKCSGILSTIGSLFLDAPDIMTFSDFFTQIGVSEYSYFTEEDIADQGWLAFIYDNKTVLINTNELTEEGWWAYTGNQEIRADAPIIITDQAISAENLVFAEKLF